MGARCLLGVPVGHSYFVNRCYMTILFNRQMLKSANIAYESQSTKRLSEMVTNTARATRIILYAYAPMLPELNKPNNGYCALQRLRFLGNNCIQHSDRFCPGVLRSNRAINSWLPTQKRFLFTTHGLYGSATPSPFHSTSTAVAKDVVLFQHDRSGFFRLLSLFCAGQLVFWTYLAHFAFTGLRDTSGSATEIRDNTKTSIGKLWGSGVNLGSDSWRFGFTLACLAVGAAIVGLGVLFGRRSVSRVILHKGGSAVTVTTQSPFGINKAQCLCVPLAHVTCHAHRQESPTFIPLRVKGHRFYFLLDREGTMNNPKLFDITVGAYRTL